MMKGMTVQYLFRQVYPLKGGETILYHAAAGGVGLIACQWARAIGVKLIGTVSSDEKAEIARAHGAPHTIVTPREDIAKRVREITGGKGVPVVYDSVGKDTLMASLDSLQVRGTLVQQRHQLGAGGHRHDAARGQGLAVDDAAGDGPLRRAAQPHARRWRDELFGLVLAGKITSEPRQTFALAEAAAAHRALESRSTVGSTVLVP